MAAALGLLAVRGATWGKEPAEAGLGAPIAVPFTLAEPGYVTLVLENAEGRRVRNLVSETEFGAGPQTVEWDGLDDVERVHTPKGDVLAPRLVPPGNYRVRGLVRPEINLRYLFTIDNPGQPPWATADKSSEWLGNHTPPMAALFVPAGQAPERPGQPTSAGGQILVGSPVTEGGSALAWLDEDGKKLWGQMWVGGDWTGPTAFARDQGEQPVPGVYAYTGAMWEDEVRLNMLVRPEHAKDETFRGRTGGNGDGRLGDGEDPPVLSPPFKLSKPAEKKDAENTPESAKRLLGLAARDGLVVASVPQAHGLVFADARAGKLLGIAPLDDARGIAFDGQGRLLALAGKRLLRFDGLTKPPQLPRAKTIIASGLDDPQGLCLDPAGNIFVSERGDAQQVKGFSPEGKLLRTIGEAGPPKPGKYEPGRMHHPTGITLDDRGRLWVAEADSVPKRLSVWSAADGKLLRAFYGPMEYGGGGQLDPQNPSRYFYSGVEFRVDWATGKNEPVDNYYREEWDRLGLKSEFKSRAPEEPIHLRGKLYLTDCYNVSPTNGARSAAIWLDEGGVARPVAAFGSTDDWKRAAEPPFRSKLRPEADLRHNGFLWTDANGDGVPQPEEAQFFPGDVSGITVGPDLSFVVANLAGKAWRYAPVGFTERGVPRYDLGKGELLAEGTRAPTTSGGGQALVGQAGWTILTVPPAPYTGQSAMAGVQHGQVRWEYPSLWPGLHPSHDAPLPDHPGELIGTTRLLGGPFTPKDGDAGQMWAVNGNLGCVYLFTTDGLFVATLFHDGRQAAWDTPTDARGMLVNGLSLHEENFWPSIQQTIDGQIYLVGGGSGGSVIRVEGLEGVRRLPEMTLKVTVPQVEGLRQAATRQEAARQRSAERTAKPLVVAWRRDAPVVDGKLDDWKKEDFVEIDARASAAVAVAGDRLFAAFRTGSDQALENSGEARRNLFKTGGGLDLQLDATPGGERLLVARVKGQTVAMLYQVRVPGTREPVRFTSNVGALTTTSIDRVEDVSAAVRLGVSDGNYEVSIPLATLGWHPKVGDEIKGDVGLLRGNGFQTLQRVYWHNKATGLMSDLASEAKLTPSLWGTWRVETR